MVSLRQHSSQFIIHKTAGKERLFLWECLHIIFPLNLHIILSFRYGINEPYIYNKLVDLYTMYLWILDHKLFNYCVFVKSFYSCNHLQLYL